MTVECDQTGRQGVRECRFSSPKDLAKEAAIRPILPNQVGLIRLHRDDLSKAIQDKGSAVENEELV